MYSMLECVFHDHSFTSVVAESSRTLHGPFPPRACALPSSAGCLCLKREGLFAVTRGGRGWGKAGAERGEGRKKEKRRGE